MKQYWKFSLNLAFLLVKFQSLSVEPVGVCLIITVLTECHLSAARDCAKAPCRQQLASFPDLTCVSSGLVQGHPAWGYTEKVGES